MSQRRLQPGLVAAHGADALGQYLPCGKNASELDCPMACGASTGCRPRSSRRSEPQMQVAESLMMAAVGLRILGSGIVS